MKKEVVNKVKELRSDLGMTQTDLARATGVSRQSIISIEKGQYIPSLPLALKIARVFDVPTDEVFRLKETD